MKTQLYLSEIKFLVTGLLIFLCAHLTAAQPGSLDQTFAASIEKNGAVRKTVVQPDGKIIVVGDFAKFNNASRNRMARLNADGSLDPTFNPPALADFENLPALPFDILVQPDGKIVIAGRFATVNGASRSCIARLNQDGSLDNSFDIGSGATSVLPVIFAIAHQPDGKIIAAGSFTPFNGVDRSDVVRLNSNGSVDLSFDFGAGIESTGAVAALAVQPDGKIVIGGRFFAGGRYCLGRLNPNGSWASDSFGIAARSYTDVLKFIQQPDGKIIIVGRFEFIETGAQTRHDRKQIARLNSDGTLDLSFDTGTGVLGTINDAALQADGKIVIGGDFLRFQQTFNSQHIVRVNADGSRDNGFNVGEGANAPINSIALAANGKIIIGGNFTEYNLTSFRNGIAQVNVEGSNDNSFNPGTGAIAAGGAETTVRAVKVQADGKVLLCGKFALVNGVGLSDIARVNADGTLDATFHYERRQTGDGCFSLAEQADGKILAGINQISVGNQERRTIIRLNADGGFDPAFDAFPAIAGGLGNSIIVQPDGKILVGGVLASGSGFGANVLRLNPDATQDVSFVTNPNQPVYSVALQADGKVLIGGDFTAVNGSPRQRIARLNSNGTLDVDFLAGTSASNRVNAIAVQPDGKIIIGGAFTQVRTVQRNGIARLQADGSLDAAFDPGNGFVGGAVNSLVLEGDGKIVAGGGFFSYNGATANALARLNQNGAFDTSFNIGAGANSGASVYTLALHNGRVLAGGTFTNFNGQEKHRLARLQKSATRSQFDFDGDGRADVSVYRPTDGNWYLLNSTTGFSVLQFGVSTDVIVPANYDSDGKTDFAVFRPSNGTWYVQSSAYGFFAAQFGQNGDIPVPADYDSDGVADFAVFRPSNGTWYVQGSSAGFIAFQFGQNQDVPVIGDYDGDGKSDYAVFRPSNGTWYLQRSTLGFAAAQFGQNGDVPVPADYSGNGKTELAVWRPATSSFYIARTLTNSAQNFDVAQFGVSTDVPVPADYDGDGRADIAVFRPLNGFWYRLNSTNGQFQAVQFGASADKPIPAAFR